MFEYKEGDKVRCKKFYKDIYKIKNLYNGSMYVISHILSFSSKSIFNSGYFSVYVGGNIFNYDEFYEYFYSKKELRELKLNKINKQNMKQVDIYKEIEKRVKKEKLIEKYYGISEIPKDEPLFTTSQETDVWEMIRDGMDVKKIMSIIRQW